MRSSDEWLSVSEAARYIGRSPSTVRNLIKGKKIRALQPEGGGWFQVSTSECDRYLESIQYTPEPALAEAA